MGAIVITVQGGSGGRRPVVLEEQRDGDDLPVRSEGTLELDESALSDGGRGGYGAALGRAVFRDAVRDGFQRARRGGGNDGGLHVLLCVEDAGLRTLRWERLCAPVDADRWAASMSSRTRTESAGSTGIGEPSRSAAATAG